MEKVELGYSGKNIPVPSNNVYLQILISKVERFAHNLRWKALFFLKPTAKPKSKQTFGFKSTAPAPGVPELKQFEIELADLIENIKFGRKPNLFQQKLKEDERNIKSETRAHVKADKSTNYYKMEAENYNKLLESEIHKEYKKASQNEVKNVEKGQKKIVVQLDLQDRVFATTQRQAFATLKDHKEQFPNNPKVRLINPSKPEVGRIAKQILEKINTTVRNKTKLKQWKNTTAVINWFKRIERKPNNKFIKFDVVAFYPSITLELLINAIHWAQQFVDISEEEIEIILEAKNSLLFKDGTPWVKKGGSFFDVGQGSYDGAESCELVGLYILSELDKIERLNVGIYRDDGLATTSASPRQVEVLKKKICAIFTKHGLSTTAEANMKVVDFLDVIFDLEHETYRPYIKPNNTPLYVDKSSNHPPNVLSNIPAGVNKRLSSISSDEKMFNMAAPLYQEALTKSGYEYQLKFDPNAAEPSKNKRNRKRNVLWFNPPFNSSVRTNIGAEFLKLIDKCFPKNHPLHKIVNRNTVKVSYSCTPNMENIISGRNAKILAKPEPEKRACSCPATKTCPLDGKCLTDNLVYHATVTEENQIVRNYTGLTSTTFKKRLGVHTQTFNDPTVSQTSLSKHIWELKKKNIEYTLKWRLVDRAKPFSPVTGICALCIREKFYIMFRPNQADLNSRNEMFNNCRHKQSQLLVEKERKRKPG